MAEVRFDQFGAAFAGRLKAIGYTLSEAARQWPTTNKAMLSRAVHGERLTAGNLLLLCRLAGLDPYAYLDEGKRRRVTMKSILDQAVTAADKRETAE